MRIISGTLGGRVFDSPKGHRTHPMSDKVRGGLFNALGDIEGLTVLDPFAGSGALSFEAVSRGAAHATAIEQDRTAQKVLDSNNHKLGLSTKVKVVKASANAWLTTTNEVFDLVLCDPPYDDLQVNLLTRLTARVKAEGLLVLSWPGGTHAPVFTGFEQLTHNHYGDATLVFYRRIS